jgi:hypothetical protein
VAVGVHRRLQVLLALRSEPRHLLVAAEIWLMAARAVQLVYERRTLLL